MRTSPGRESHNLFFALRPSEATGALIEAAASTLRSAAAPGGRWIRPVRYHLTLHYLGSHVAPPPTLVALACAAGESVRASRFDLTLDRAGCFENRDIPWWLGCSEVPEGLLSLWSAIAQGFKAHDSRTLDDSRLAAHATILRDAKRPLPPAPIAPIVWPVEEFVLIDSRLGPQAEYTVLRRWPLSP